MVSIQDLVFSKERLIENITFMNDYILKNEFNWTFVIKALNNYPDLFIEKISDLPINSIASDNENHLRLIKHIRPTIETWFLNYSGKLQTSEFIDVNLTHSSEVINEKTCLMLSIDPDRDGLSFNDELKVNRYGCYLDCSKPPDINFYKKWSKLKINPTVIQSLGTSVSFDKIEVLKSCGVNHFRLGEILLTGKDLINGKNIKGLRQDVFTSKKKITYNIISNLNF